MAWDGSGNFDRNNGSTGWRDDDLAGTGIESVRHDDHDQDLANGIDACLNKNGENSPTSNINWGGHRITNVGTGLSLGDVASVAQVQNNSLNYISAISGTANAITGSLSPTPASLTAGLRVGFKPTANNTGAVTFDLNSLGAKDVRRGSTGIANPLAGGELISGNYVEMVYDGTSWAIINSTPQDYLEYSTSEKFTGRYDSDESPIFIRKYDFGALPDTDLKTLAHGLTTLNRIVRLWGVSNDPTINFEFPLPFIHPATIAQSISLFRQGNSIAVETGLDRSGFTQTEIYIEYTKT